MSVATLTPGLLAGRRALVTGGARGIGAAVAARLAASGAAGVLVDLPDAVAAATPPPGWSALGADVRDDDAVARVVADAAEALGGLDLVVAAAGVVPSWSRVAETDMEDFDRVMAVNVRGVASTVRHAAPLLGAGATVVAVASLNSWRGDARITSYVASKHAVLGIVRSAALDLGPAGVRVNAVAPGPIATEALRSRMAARAGDTGLDVDAAIAAAGEAAALRRIATEDEVADAVLVLSSPLAGGTTGHLLPVDGGLV